MEIHEAMKYQFKFEKIAIFITATIIALIAAGITLMILWP